jgi:WD40 repeat protein
VAVTADGKEVVALSPGLAVRRFDARTGSLRAASRLPGGRAYATWLSPRGTLAVLLRYTGNASVLELWDLAREKRLQILSLTAGTMIWNAAFSADERRVAIADSASKEDVHRVVVWEVATGKLRVLWSLEKQIGTRVFFPVVSLSPDGKRLAACHNDQTLRCWELDGGKLLWESKENLWTGLVFFRPDGRVLLAGRRLWDAATGRVVEDLTPPMEEVYPVGYSPNGEKMLFETGAGGTGGAGRRHTPGPADAGGEGGAGEERRKRATGGG